MGMGGSNPGHRSQASISSHTHAGTGLVGRLARGRPHDRTVTGCTPARTAKRSAVRPIARRRWRWVVKSGFHTVAWEPGRLLAPEFNPAAKAGLAAGQNGVRDASGAVTGAAEIVMDTGEDEPMAALQVVVDRRDVAGHVAT